jgi:hypothetical protein
MIKVDNLDAYLEDDFELLVLIMIEVGYAYTIFGCYLNNLS